jgi:hypothetical protein
MENNKNSDNGLIGKAKQFDEIINTIQKQFFSVLSDFGKYYIVYNKNPEVSEFENYYSSSKGQLQTISSSLFSTTNNIDKIIEELNKEMSLVSIKLEKAKKINSELTQRLHNLETTQNGSEIMLDDSKDAYNIQYYKNWQMFIGVIGVTILIFKIYKTPVKATNN